MARIVFFGSPQAAVGSLLGLVAAGHQIAAVYTRPDAVSGRARTPQPTPVRVAALNAGLPTETPATLRDPAARDHLAAFQAEAFVVVAYGRLLPPPILELPRLGALNVHPSLLPRYRGPSPVATAILEGARETGVSVMLLDRGMDSGPVLARSEPVAIAAADTGGSLTARLFELGAHLLVRTLADWQAHRIVPVPQDESSATVTKLLERSDGRIDWTRDAAYIERMVRAYDPWPGTFTGWNGRNLKILASMVTGVGGGRESGSAAERRPGTVSRTDDGLRVACGRGSLLIERLQLEGRQAATAAEFRRGYPDIESATLGG